jgi:hypothetical protein
MAWLTKEIADALCTVITLGFAASDCKMFEYDEDKDRNKYEDVQKYFSSSGVKITIGLSTPKDKMPCILGKSKYVYDPEALKGTVESFWKWIHTKEVQGEGTDAPRGAYIGGKASVGSIDIAGPSKLEQYKPIYRIPDIAVKENYKNALADVTKAIEILNKSGLAQGVTIHTDKAGLGDQSEGSLAPNHIFKSYHGMIRAMMAYGAVKEDVYFEMALGANTNKVSSCVPCSIFMSANENPATSTHLGRGDNWNIPGASTAPDRSTKEEKWKKKITACYKAGLQSLSSKGVSRINEMAAAFTDNSISDAIIPAVFLEALTFEDAFTKRIIDTFSNGTAGS